MADDSVTAMLLACLFALAVSPCGADEPQDNAAAALEPAPAAQNSISDEDRAQAVALAKQLSSPVFEERQAATKQLGPFGLAAVEPLKEVALSTSLEAGLRAVQVLREIYLSEDAAAADASEDVLKTLATTASPPVAAQSAGILKSFQFTVRQQRSVEAIRRMGGQVDIETVNPVAVDGELVRPPGGWARSVVLGRKWTGGDEGLKYVLNLETLMTVFLLSGHSISDDGIQQLEQALPEGGLQKRGSAFLGVGTRPDVLGCYISLIREGSAADQGLLREGDVVVEIAGKPVQAQEDLIGIIGEFDPGDEVQIVFLRGDPLMRMKLHEMLSVPSSYSPLLVIGIFSQMRRETTVVLGEWKIGE